MLLDIFRKRLRLHRLYDRFELIISAVLLIVISAIIVYTTTVMVMTLIGDIDAGIHFTDQNALKETFGLILTILILIEFNHSIALAMRRRSGVLEVRVVILISIIVIARKLILLDYAKTGLDTLLGLGGLALSLGALYWLLSDVERRRPPAVREE
ncbi:MAG: phosphate-starvation-inducible PsiE family protein [Stellaceae bacterium]